MLLFDEPFGALDPVTRFELQQQFLDLQRDFRKTSIFVTHDVREAIRRIRELRKGVTFHNGKDLTADDVIASYRHHMGKDSKSAVKPFHILPRTTNTRAAVCTMGKTSSFSQPAGPVEHSPDTSPSQRPPTWEI